MKRLETISETIIRWRSRSTAFKFIQLLRFLYVRFKRLDLFSRSSARLPIRLQFSLPHYLLTFLNYLQALLVIANFSRLYVHFLAEPFNSIRAPSMIGPLRLVWQNVELQLNQTTTGGHGRQKIQYINHVLRSSLIKSVDFFNFKNKLPYGQRTYADVVAVALRKG